MHTVRILALAQGLSAAGMMTMFLLGGVVGRRPRHLLFKNFPVVCCGITSSGMLPTRVENGSQTVYAENGPRMNHTGREFFSLL
jgi:hypothetical protein